MKTNLTVTADWQTWHTPRDEALASIAADNFSHARAKFVHFMDAYECYLYARADDSPTGVRLAGVVPDCPEIEEAIRARGAAIEPPR